jgi:hypothetical protein
MEENEMPGATRYDGLQPGLTDSSHHTIKAVFGPHRHMVVYITDHGIKWHYNQLPERLRPAVGEFEALKHLARSSLPAKLQERAEELLAAALYKALLTPDRQNPEIAFKTVKDYICRKSAERARLYYVLLSLVLAMLFAGAACVFTYLAESADVKSVSTGVAAGVLGAAISIIQRGWRLLVDPLDSVYRFAAQGFVRVVLGGVFGAVFVILSQANLAFGTIANNKWALFGLAVAAGVSERFVPDLLERSARELPNEKPGHLDMRDS